MYLYYRYSTSTNIGTIDTRTSTQETGGKREQENTILSVVLFTTYLINTHSHLTSYKLTNGSVFNGPPLLFLTMFCGLFTSSETLRATFDKSNSIDAPALCCFCFRFLRCARLFNPLSVALTPTKPKSAKLNMFVLKLVMLMLRAVRVVGGGSVPSANRLPRTISKDCTTSARNNNQISGSSNKFSMSKCEILITSTDSIRMVPCGGGKRERRTKENGELGWGVRLLGPN